MKTLAAIFGSIFFIVFWAYIGTIFWPFASWLTGAYIGPLTGLFALFSIVVLIIVGGIMKKSKLVGVTPACVFFAALLVVTNIICGIYLDCRYHNTYDRPTLELPKYHNGLILIGDYFRHNGLANKFGKTVIEPKYRIMQFIDGKWIAVLENNHKSEVCILNEEDFIMEKIRETNRKIVEIISEDRFITREKNGSLYYVESSRGTLFGGYEDIDYNDRRDIFECYPGEESTYDCFDYDGYRTEKK